MTNVANLMQAFEDIGPHQLSAKNYSSSILYI